MTRPNIIFSSLFSSDAVDPKTLFNTEAIDNFTLDYDDTLQNFGDNPALENALDADPTSIQSTQITWGNTTNGATLTGSGLTQIEDLEGLEQRLENGIASGAFDTLRFYSGGNNVLSLQFANNAITLSSGGQSLALRGALPTGFQDIFDFATQMGNVLSETNLSEAASFLSNYDLEGLRLIDDGVTLFDATLDNAGLRINAAGGEFRVDGTLPADSLGSLVELFQDLIALDNTAQGFNSLNQVANLSIAGMSLTAADGTQLIRTTGPLDEVSPLFEATIIEGTSGDDVDVYVDGYASDSNSVVARLGAGNDSAEIYGGGIETPVTINGGAGHDRVRVFDYSSQQVVVDFFAGTISGRELEDQINYSVDIIDVEVVDISTFQRTVVLGDDKANTAMAGQTFGRFEFYGGGGTDILDLTQVSKRSSNDDGLLHSQLSEFSVVYGGNNAVEMTHEDLSVTFVLGDVEQVRVRGDDGGTVLLTLNQVITASDSYDNFTMGTSGVDSLKGGKGADILLGQSGGDFIYGDGIQANLTGAVAGQVYRMYQATLDRAPDAAGYEGWVTGLFEGTLGLDQMARGFVNSPEFKATYGSLDNSGFVELLYQNVLGRAADAGGLQGWLDAMAAGTTREGVVIGFSQSNEFKLSTGQASADFAMSQSEMFWTDEIYRVYRATLDRDPDVAGFLGWAELLGSGTGFDTMIGGFVNSPEFKATYGNLDNAGFVELLYQNVLDRSADAGGLQGWLDAMDAGTSRAGVVRGFSQSSEFQLGTAAELKAWVQAQGTHDEILSGPGTDMDVLTGGLLSDVFVFEGNQPARATILDFEAWDVVQLNGYDISNFISFRNALSQQGNDVVFASQDTQITFNNMQIDEFTGDQVEFFAGF